MTINTLVSSLVIPLYRKFVCIVFVCYVQFRKCSLVIARGPLVNGLCVSSLHTHFFYHASVFIFFLTSIPPLYNTYIHVKHHKVHEKHFKMVHFLTGIPVAVFLLTRCKP